ncbi:GNAT family N-acetyltransferase [Muricauda sp. SCSIO 65647]|nr:GNAT family N-acetyltransferase [Muricauda sp. SCSIO 65647]
MEKEKKILGTYIIKPNQIDLGSHIANASYMVHPEARGLGVGQSLGKHSLITAKELGFLGMQFNFIVSTNKAAIALWIKLGFKIIGTVPKAFKHNRLGLVDAHIMFREL